jgi:hypothetical protein
MGTGGPIPGGGAWPGRDADHSPPSSAEVKNESRSYTSFHPKRLHGVYQDHFTFYLNNTLYRVSIKGKCWFKIGFLTTVKSFNSIMLRTKQEFSYKRRIMTEKIEQRHTTAAKETQKKKKKTISPASSSR